ncbi:hypothetical protein [Chitinophaga sp. sic0106]|uniref:hypothetical protein n=1 Tax=Chitinophaga sp. sic0106 TaxID=2854785 RepID=UPI001C45A4A4|nr:hypothetical protein [Chitinophaga sp. sic0106]MBV7531354.1 hypothetical protein [Chitinophaga sp. sic0106]
MHTKIIIGLLLLCSCASSRKSITREERRKDSVGITVQENSVVTETTVSGTVPAYTRPDSAGLTWYLPAEDTGTRSESVQAGALVLTVTSKPRRDTSGKVSGRDLQVRARKNPEEVMAPVDFQQKKTETGSSIQAGRKQESTAVSTKTIDKTGINWLVGAGIAISLVIAVIYLIRKYVK